MSKDEHIVVTVERVVCGHNSRLGRAKITSGAPYVRRFHDAEKLCDLAAQLAKSGHAFSVEIAEREVSMLEWAASCEVVS